MPNWVYNNVLVSGKIKEVDRFKEHMSRPFKYQVKSVIDNVSGYTEETGQFNFFNVIAPSEDIMDQYAEQPARAGVPTSDPQWWAKTLDVSETDNSWYNWNIRNWGTKWNAANATVEELAQRRPDKKRLLYTFDTPWDAPIKLYNNMAEQWPNLVFFMRSQEETGWGVRAKYKNGKGVYLDYLDYVMPDFLDKLLRK